MILRRQHVMSSTMLMPVSFIKDILRTRLWHPATELFRHALLLLKCWISMLGSYQLMNGMMLSLKHNFSAAT